MGFGDFQMLDSGIFNSSLFYTNSFFFYIWTLTLSMAVAATVVFFRTKKAGSRFPEKVSIHYLCWLGCAFAGLLSIIFFAFSDSLEPHDMLTVLSIILGIGYLVNGIAIGKNIYTLSGIGWWIGAALLATQENTESLAILAFLIILLTILPLVIEMRQKRIGFF